MVTRAVGCKASLTSSGAGSQCGGEHWRKGLLAVDDMRTELGSYSDRFRAGATECPPRWLS